MKARETQLLAGLILLLAIAGTLLLVLGGGESRATPDAPDVAPAEVAAHERPDVPTPAVELPTAVAPSADRPEERVASPSAPAASNPGYGILDGRILLASTAAGKVRQYTILVEELINTNLSDVPTEREPVRLSRGFAAEANESPLYFAFEKVPFSEFGYRVTVFVPGLNGSSQVVRVTEAQWNPDVTLSLVGGSPFSLRLIDQMRDPHAGVDVAMVPVGHPPGRPVLNQQTNNFGTAVWENVLAGEYDVQIGGQSVATVTVDAPGFVRDEAGVGAQSALVEVPKGREVKVEVFDDAGYGLPGAEVVLTAIDTVENRRFTQQTTDAGVVDFRYVTPGRYQLDVRAPSRQPTSRTLEVPAEGDPIVMRLRLPLL